jgi:hypothetical protein
MPVFGALHRGGSQVRQYLHQETALYVMVFDDEKAQVA